MHIPSSSLSYFVKSIFYWWQTDLQLTTFDGGTESLGNLATTGKADELANLASSAVGKQ